MSSLLIIMLVIGFIVFVYVVMVTEYVFFIITGLIFFFTVFFFITGDYHLSMSLVVFGVMIFYSILFVLGVIASIFNR